MAALTSERNTPRRSVTGRNAPMAAATVLYAGGMSAFNAAGFLVPVTASATLKGAARTARTVDNSSGAAGDVYADQDLGVFRWSNSADADLITRADIGSDCYGVDDQTVAKTSASNTRSAVGKIVDVDSAGVWVRQE